MPRRPRFWENIDKSGGPSACWPWTGSKVGIGYGKASVGNRSVRAHREAWERTHGPIPRGMVVCHRCDNPPCCNPEHLFLGTVAQNNADAVAKGRQARGERNNHVRLTEQQVHEIRSMDAELTSKDIAKAYGVDRTTISLVRLGMTWKHI